MKIPYMFQNDIQANIKNEYLSNKEFHEDLLRQNCYRGKLLAIITIAFESVFLVIDVISAFLKVNDTFAFYSYLAMYSIMIVINTIHLFLIDCFYKNKISIRTMNVFITIYLTFMMTWGSVVSLMDQKLYAQLMAFMVNMIASSVIYLLDAKRMSIPYLISTLTIMIGLPFFQSSGNVLFGHYVNLTVFIVIFWIASRIIYRNYCENFIIKKLMHQSELLLKKEMEEKKIINEKLAAANAQLKKMALIDDLTELPNRRSFHEFIDKMFESNIKSSLNASVIMIDIDYFKQYNDLYGHEKGDLALIAVAKQIAAMVENSDQFAVRWGGEEFIYIAFDKNRENILTTADTLRLKILDLKIPNPGSSINSYITISLGTSAGNAANKEAINGLIKLADQYLYQAKSNGRNCVASSDFNNETR